MSTGIERLSIDCQNGGVEISMPANADNSGLPDSEESNKGVYIHADKLLTHVQNLETKLPPDETHFGHPDPPELHMSRVPTKEPGVMAMMAVTKRCISAVLLRERKGEDAKIGSPAEVLVMQGEDQITCAIILALEDPKLSAADPLIVPDRNQGQTQGLSLMSGGLVPVAPAPRVAIVVGTGHGRVIAIEFSVKPKSLQLTRRNYYAGKEVLTYFEPLPFGTITEFQSLHRRGVPGPKGEKPRRVVPFEPSDAVCTLAPYGDIIDGKAVTYVWISFADGTAVRLHHASFFASVVQKHTESQPNPKSLESILGHTIIRWEARLPPLESTHFTLVPVPKYHPSPLAPFPAWKKPEFDEHLDDPTASRGRQDDQESNFEAVVYCSGAMAESFPTLAFYTTEDQFNGRVEEPEDDDEDQSGSGGIITSVIGGLFGMLTATSSTSKTHNEEENESLSEPIGYLEFPEEWDPEVPFPSINLEPYRLVAGCEIHDPPRQIMECTIDPEGDFAAISDTLGRVSLIDLSTKQIIRMWKGFRDTSCYWIEIPRQSTPRAGQKNKILYLVIHSRQRKVVEIWRTRHGPKVKTLQVNRDAQIVVLREMSRVGFVSTCYLAHSNVPGSKLNQIERISVLEDEKAGITNVERNRPAKPVTSFAPTDTAARLNRLKQLLSETNVECKSVDVFKALENIKSVEDLAKALDIIASSPTLETKMGVEGSTFQRLSISQCQQKLDEAINESGKEALTNPHVQHLAFKIAYYNQVSKAYDVIYRHEISKDVGIYSGGVVAPSSWGLEAIGWTSVHEKITKRSIDDDIPEPPTGPMRFYQFANALEPPKNYMEEDFILDRGGYKVYFSDSTRTRREILARIFKPLLGDVFSFKTVIQIFEALGTKSDDEYVMKCFGEWFSSLSVKEVTKQAIFAHDSPVKKWLQDRIRAQLDEAPEADVLPMESIYQYCRKSDELVRGFWLATLCHESISQVGKEKEEETYGKVQQAELVSRWEALLRQIRVCLLVSLRLHGIQLGPLPLSVHEVDKADEFSVYQWLAHDELLMSHKHKEILSLEKACKISSHAFDASTAIADAPAKWEVLQASCLSSALSEVERAEYLVDFDDDERLGALLLYLNQHNSGKILVAHRALLLAAKWGRFPADLDILQDSLVALRAIDTDEHKRIASAVRLEIWQTRIRPMYRALMFGFDDVQEVSEEVVGPLFNDVDWVKTFSEVTSTALEMLNEFEWHEAENMNLRDDFTAEPGLGTWPTPAACPILNKLIDKNKKLRKSAFEAHQMLLSALKLTQDFAQLARCIPSFYDLFTPGALFKKAIPLEDAEDNQQALMQDAVVDFARNYGGPSMDSLDLGEIEKLSDLFEFEMDNIRTLFLLAMYEFGKDRLVDETITRSAPSISIVHFCDGGVEIVCRRLNHLLHVEPSDDINSIMGTLDANMCEWVKDKAESSEALVDDADMAVPPGNTHLFALRLLSLGASADIEKSERIKIHSLIVLSGSIVKGLEGLRQEENKKLEDQTSYVPVMKAPVYNSQSTIESGRDSKQISRPQNVRPPQETWPQANMAAQDANLEGRSSELHPVNSDSNVPPETSGEADKTIEEKAKSEEKPLDFLAHETDSLGFHNASNIYVDPDPPVFESSSGDESMKADG